MSNCNDSYKGKDKVKHFCACLVIAIISPILAIVAAIGKEWYDMKQNGNHWCWKDIVADVAGIIVGTIIFSLLWWIVWQ